MQHLVVALGVQILQVDFLVKLHKRNKRNTQIDREVQLQSISEQEKISAILRIGPKFKIDFRVQLERFPARHRGIYSRQAKGK